MVILLLLSHHVPPLMSTSPKLARRSWAKCFHHKSPSSKTSGSSKPAQYLRTQVAVKANPRLVLVASPHTILTALVGKNNTTYIPRSNFLAEFCKICAKSVVCLIGMSQNHCGSEWSCLVGPGHQDLTQGAYPTCQDMKVVKRTEKTRKEEKRKDKTRTNKRKEQQQTTHKQKLK